MGERVFVEGNEAPIWIAENFGERMLLLIGKNGDGNNGLKRPTQGPLGIDNAPVLIDAPSVEPKNA